MRARALALAEGIGAAAAAAARMRSLGRAWGLPKQLPGRKRGLYGAGRSHPYGLSAREQQVLQAPGQRQRNTDIAARLGLAERTVEHHVSAVLRKLDASDRVSAVDIALGQGLLAAREAVDHERRVPLLRLRIQRAILRSTLATTPALSVSTVKVCGSRECGK